MRNHETALLINAQSQTQMGNDPIEPSHKKLKYPKLPAKT